jgi:hypothetical protein
MLNAPIALLPGQSFAGLKSLMIPSRLSCLYELTGFRNRRS